MPTRSTMPTTWDLRCSPKLHLIVYTSTTAFFVDGEHQEVSALKLVQTLPRLMKKIKRMARMQLKNKRNPAQS